MVNENGDYGLFFEFFDSFSKAGIEGITPEDPLIIVLERFIETNKQLFYISDVILMDVLFVSKSIYPMFGISPEKFSKDYFLTTTHPDDYYRHRLARTKLFGIAQELFIHKKGIKIISTNVRARKPDGSYFDVLYQAFLFYSKVPYESVFLILVMTDITGLGKVHKGFHYYIGEDRKFFRYPDKELLMTGSVFSHTEFSIINLIDDGLSSKEIAQKLFRSIHTVNTHRTNIIKKSGKSSITEVIHELKEKGLL